MTTFILSLLSLFKLALLVNFGALFVSLVLLLVNFAFLLVI
ncbi:hypothetical protein ACQKKK_19910 [Peribacillus sp. NPDC006672]